MKEYTPVDVIMPARNTADTIEPLVKTLATHPLVADVMIFIDGDDEQDTAGHIPYNDNNVMALETDITGKGQLVTLGLQLAATPYVMFCDSDITGLTYDHISLLLAGAAIGDGCMTVGVPDIPPELP